jgi:hypothetical protein
MKNKIIVQKTTPFGRIKRSHWVNVVMGSIFGVQAAEARGMLASSTQKYLFDRPALTLLTFCWINIFGVKGNIIGFRKFMLQ